MTTDPNWLKSITESYTQEVSESARNLQEKAEDLYNLVETIQTALQVDLTEAQVQALISALSEAKTGLSQRALELYYTNASNDRADNKWKQGWNYAMNHAQGSTPERDAELKTLYHKSGKRDKGMRRAIRSIIAKVKDGEGDYGGDTKYI
jgi:hypothetical protein